MNKFFTKKDIDFFKETVFEAGSIALNFQKQHLVVNRKTDKTIVTEADIRVQDYIVGRISGRFKDMNFICEEDLERKRENAIDDNTVTAIIDPIDGTAMFSMYLPIWCVSLGIMEGYSLRYGFVYSPGCSMFFYNDDDNSYLNDNVVTVNKNILIDKETNIFYSSEIHGLLAIDFPGKVRNLGSTAFHACLTVDNIRNRTLAYIGKSFLWDWAGAIPVIEKAGGNVRYINGRGIDIREILLKGYELPHYVVAYNSDDFDSIRKIFKWI